jgi:ribonuclease E
MVEEATQDDRAAARRRSTVREKVSFGSSAPVAEQAPAAVSDSAPEPAASPAPEPTPAASGDDAAPRKAGWWSRRFGNGE